MCEKGYDLSERFQAPPENNNSFTFNNIRIPTKEEIKKILSPFIWKENKKALFYK